MRERFEELIEIVKSAGEIIEDGFSTKKSIKHKGIVDLVTEYDVKTEEYLISKISQLYPEFEIIGEESYTDSKYSTEKAIYIDPIDGTTNFVHRIPHVAISIGIWENNTPICGVVYNPILKELFTAFKAEGAYLNGSKIAVSSQSTLQSSLIGTGFPYAKVEKGSAYRWVVDTMSRILPYIQDIRRLGSAALDICYLADGRIDGFYEIDLKPWDVAGAIAILLEAGGRVSDLKNQSYKIGDDAIVASNGNIHEELLKIVGKNEYIRNT